MNLSDTDLQVLSTLGRFCLVEERSASVNDVQTSMRFAPRCDVVRDSLVHLACANLARHIPATTPSGTWRAGTWEAVIS